ncbi:hypothetical protein BHE74_00043207, partial [Ensete ventricosum]
SGSQPLVALDEGSRSEVARLRRVADHPEPRPSHPAAGVRPRPSVHVLAVVEGAQREAAIPLQPPRRGDQAVEVRLHEHRPRVLLPRPAEVGGEVGLHRDKVRRRRHLAPLDGDAGVLVRVFPPLRREDVLLVRQRLPGVEVAVLEHHRRVAEDEVDGAVDIAFSVELAEGVDVEGVLVAYEAAPVEGGEVGADPESHGLVLAGACCVLYGDVSHEKSIANHSCKG